MVRATFRIRSYARAERASCWIAARSSDFTSASIGQNSIQQAKVFHEALHLTGVVMTKLDGTGKGGVIMGIEEQLGVPVKLVGTGEAVDDLEPFDPRDYVESLFAAS